MRSPQSGFIPLAIAVAGLAVFWWWKSDTAGNPSPAGESAAPAASRSRDRDLASAFDHLPGQSDLAGSVKHLAELRIMLAAMPRSEAVSWIRSFLASRQDKETGLSFEIDPDGNLKEWPTFRTFLFDALSTRITADEWALALRNAGRAETTEGTRKFLRTKTEELIQNPSWQASPSIGYLNAFDVLVHTKALESSPLLSRLVQQDPAFDVIAPHLESMTGRLVQFTRAGLPTDPSKASS